MQIQTIKHTNANPTILVSKNYMHALKANKIS